MMMNNIIERTPQSALRAIFSPFSRVTSCSKSSFFLRVLCSAIGRIDQSREFSYVLLSSFPSFAFVGVLLVAAPPRCDLPMKQKDPLVDCQAFTHFSLQGPYALPEWKRGLCVRQFLEIREFHISAFIFPRFSVAFATQVSIHQSLFEAPLLHSESDSIVPAVGMRPLRDSGMLHSVKQSKSTNLATGRDAFQRRPTSPSSPPFNH